MEKAANDDTRLFLWSSAGSGAVTEDIKELTLSRFFERDLELVSTTSGPFFSANDSETGRELWFGDGPREGI